MPDTHTTNSSELKLSFWDWFQFIALGALMALGFAWQDVQRTTADEPYCPTLEEPEDQRTAHV